MNHKRIIYLQQLFKLLLISGFFTYAPLVAKAQWVITGLKAGPGISNQYWEINSPLPPDRSYWNKIKPGFEVMAFQNYGFKNRLWLQLAAGYVQKGYRVDHALIRKSGKNIEVHSDAVVLHNVAFDLQLNVVPIRTMPLWLIAGLRYEQRIGHRSVIISTKGNKFELYDITLEQMVKRSLGAVVGIGVPISKRCGLTAEYNPDLSLLWDRENMRIRSHYVGIALVINLLGQ